MVTRTTVLLALYTLVLRTEDLEAGRGRFRPDGGRAAEGGGTSSSSCMIASSRTCSVSSPKVSRKLHEWCGLMRRQAHPQGEEWSPAEERRALWAEAL
eukprot:3877743-Prymnesium_polylepis.1